MGPPLTPVVSPRHAVVCGSSMAGLLTAGLLARHFERVTVVERDGLEDTPLARKGVPQGTQTHILLKRGMDIAAAIFPGLMEDLQGVGAQALDMAADGAWHVAGVWRKRVPSGVTMYSQTRPLFEWRVRSMLAALPNVRILDRHDVTGLLHVADGTRVTGLKVRAPGSTEETRLEADLVVDASGRGSRMPQWLEALGQPRVEETRIQIDVGYATRLYRIPPGFDAGWKSLIVSAEFPTNRRFGTVIPVEGGRWTVTLSGWLKDYPPTDEEGFLAYARSLAQPHLYEALKQAEPLGPILSYRFSHSQWRHFERLPRVPEGLLVVGDAFCSFNPIYGQGITSSALLVEALGECLRKGLDGLSRRYFERAGQLLKVPWALSTTEDFRLPELADMRPPGSSFLYWYGERFQRLTATDDEAVRTFMEVMHMLRPPTSMFSPRLFWKALTSRPVSAVLPPAPKPLPVHVSKAA
ncbi:FAD-dependent oxidoreductase [Pyxidicoccus sp. MSG2]|uniref:FAD-dependent oxidoreductase n=1 Tax=Pyxidicoccus sp. MSG2 TaxID=2996790 RepID=UPI00226F2E01|nr:FAD-dependent monooxygenase [Pyxidicoccus sp. MSG2]MCY1019217.1 FAD-dependent monooxygenase [Pyxidicoccus sp. MSG2]